MLPRSDSLKAINREKPNDKTEIEKTGKQSWIKLNSTDHVFICFSDYLILLIICIFHQFFNFANRIYIEGVSTHSFRRTALTQMSDQNIPIRVIAQMSGHRDLSQLYAYLEVRDEQVLGAAASLSMLSPIMQGVGKNMEDDTATASPNPRPVAKKKPNR